MNDAAAGLLIFYRRLVDADIHCLVVGSVAAMHFGEPRSTIDIDMMVVAWPEDAHRIAALFPPPRFYVPPIEVISQALSRPGRGMFNIIDTETCLKADCYTAGDDDLARYALAHAVEGTLGDETVWYAPASDIIAHKLRYYLISQQDKHLRDIRLMLAMSPEAIDHGFLETWTQEHGCAELWKRCLNRVGEE